MKKILFLLLISVAMYGQVPADATPLENIQITNNVEDNASTKVTVQNANGVQNWKFATSLPVSTATANALDLKAENSSGAIEGFAITNNGDGTVNIATGTAYLRTTNSPYSPLIKYVIPAVTNLALTDNANNFVLVDYNGGSPALTVTIAPGTINTTTNSIAYLISRVGTTLDYINLVGQNIDANGKLRRRFLNSESLRRASGVVLTASNRNLLLTAGLFYSGLIEATTPAFNTSTGSTFTQAYLNGSTWVRTTGNTQINNTQYSLAGVLTTMPSNDYRVDYVYTLADNPSKLYVLLGTTTYNNITNARLAPVPVDLPTELQYLGARVGRVIIQKDATTTETTSEFATIYQAGTAQLHNDLGGLNLGDFQHLTVAEKANLEVITNKQNSLAVDGTNTKYPTVTAVNSGLGLKANDNQVVHLSDAETITGAKIFTPTVSAVTALARGTFINPTLTATANNDVLVGLDIAPTFSNGGFTGVNQVDLRIPRTLASSSNVFEIKRANTALLLYADVAETTFYHSLTSGSLRFNLGFASMMRVLPNSGNILIQNGGTFTDAGFRLDVNGTTRLQNTLTLGTSPTTSAGTYDFLTRNTSTGVVERVLSNSIAPIASPAFTGIPTAPTATAGTNTTQIATTAFVLANASNIPQLESNPTNLTVWNNGKGNISGNTSFGENSLSSNVLGYRNTAFGSNSQSAIVDQYGNTSVGQESQLSSTGNNNTSIGYQSLSSGSGSNNIAVGIQALRNLTTGSGNIGIGDQSGFGITTNTNSIFLGNATIPLGIGNSNEIVIGQSATGAGSNTATLGNTSITNTILRGTVTTNGSFVNSSAPATNALLANGTTLSNPISGTGTTNFLPKFTSSGVIGNSQIFDNGTNIRLYQGIGSDLNFGFEHATTTVVGGWGAAFTNNNETGVLLGRKLNLAAIGTLNSSSMSILPDGGNLLLSTTTDNGVDKLQVNGSASISSLAGTGTRTVVASSTGQLSAVSNIDYRNYKVYTALLTQTGTNAPVATVLENTLGAITLNYTSAGSFTATSSSLFTLNKTSVFTQELFGLDSKSFQQVTSASNINLYTSSGGSYISGLYNNTLIEIRVYN